MELESKMAHQKKLSVRQS